MIQTLIYNPESKSYEFSGSDEDNKAVPLGQPLANVLDIKELQSVAIGGLEALVLGELAEGVIAGVGGD